MAENQSTATRDIERDLHIKFFLKMLYYDSRRKNTDAKNFQ